MFSVVFKISCALNLNFLFIDAAVVQIYVYDQMDHTTFRLSSLEWTQQLVGKCSSEGIGRSNSTGKHIACMYIVHSSDLKKKKMFCSNKKSS